MKILYHQLRNLGYLFQGRPLTYPPLGSATLDQDDVEIAKHWLINKEKWNEPFVVKEYERKFANWNGSEYAFAFMGGRVALSACIYALGLQRDDEVILPGYTCVVVDNAFHYAGVKPIYSDIELDTYGLDASLLEEKINGKTKAIMLHHLYGLVSRDYEKIIQIAEKYNLKIIEDCAHSTGAVYKGKKVGNYGDVAFYSSEQSKVFTTFAGGLATTNNGAIAKRLSEFYENSVLPETLQIEKQLKNIIFNYYAYKHRKSWLLADIYSIKYLDQRLISTTREEIDGIRPSHYLARMPAPVAAIGLNQLKKIDYYNQKRRETAVKWSTWCKQNNYQTPMVVQDSIPVFLRYPVIVEEEKKQDISWAEKDLGVHLGVWFVSNLHPADRLVSGCPNSNKAVKQCVNFPTIINL